MREKLLKRLSAAQFALYELRLFLDTHKDDKEALAMFDKYKSKFETLKKEFEEQFGPLTLNGQNSDEWLKDPWPWELA
ncbi:MAG: spore coat protein CotJB [Eubacterium sp.]|nr:spore coat protein CotJB [Eubacterium sp.]